MRFLVDANVLSEPTRPRPSERVVSWLRTNERELAVDPIVLGELRFGIHLLPAGKRRREDGMGLPEEPATGSGAV